MTIKDTCQECGRLFKASKLHKSKIDKRTICSFCFNSENKSILRSKLIDTYNPVGLSFKESKSITREANNYNTGYLKKEELEVMKIKYGKNTYDKVKQLKKQMTISKNKNKAEFDNKPDNRNTKLIEGLKKLS